MTQQSEPSRLIDELLTRRGMLKASAVGGAGLLLAGSPAVASAKLLGRAAAGGNLTIGSTTDMAPSNFLRTGTNGTSASLLFDTLANVKPGTTKLVPAVASSWEWNKPGTELTIKLRDDVRYHTGRKLTPEDVIFSFETTKNPLYQAQIGPTVELVKSFKVTGKHELRVTLERSMPEFEAALALVPMIDQKTVSGLFDATQVVGTGPFKFDSWQPQNNFTVSRNPHYWQKGAPVLSGVTVNFYSSATALVNALRAGEISMAYNLVPSQVQLLVQGGQFAANTSNPAFAEYYLGVNVKAAPFDDVRVRQAVAYSLDRARILQEAFSGFGKQTCLPWAATLPGIPDSYANFYGYEPAKAKQLLKEAGLNKPTVTITTGAGNTTTAAILNVVEYNLSQSGFNVNSQSVAATTFQADIAQANIPGLWINNVGQTYLDIPTVLLGNAPFEIGANTSNVTDPRYKQLADAVVFAKTTAQQAKANKALSQYVLNQAWHITFAQAPITSAIVKSLTGVSSTGQSALSLTSAKLS